MRQTTIRIVAVAALVLLTGAFALHLRLVKSAPRDGEVVTGLPTEIRLWFSQKPDVGLTTIRLLGEDSSAVEVGKVIRTADSLSVKAPLPAALPPGTYLVSWRTMSKDGHVVRGTYHFNVVPRSRD